MRRCVPVLLVAAAVLAGCAGSGDGPAAPAGTGSRTATLKSLDPQPIADNPAPALPATVRSYDGEQVTVRDTSRIVAVDRYGTLAQTVWALGLGGRLVGRSTSASFPAVRQVPNVAGGNGALSIEAVLALRPTVLLTDPVTSNAAIRNTLRSAGVTVIYFDPNRSVETVGTQIQAVADALGVAGPGKALAERTSKEIAAATANKPGGTPLRVAFLYLRGPVTMLAGPGSGADSLIRALGAEDAGAGLGLKESFVPITSEAMISAAPRAFLVMSEGLASVGGPEGVAKLPGVGQTPAGRERRIVDMAESVLLSFGPQTGVVLAALRPALYG